MHNILFLILLLFAQLVFADTSYNKVDFTLAVEEVVDNDLLKVQMYAREDGKNSVKVASMINQKMRQAFAIITQYPNVKKQTINYSINPKYEKSRIVGWSGTQYIRLQSTDIDTMTALVQKLQNILLIDRTNFTQSDALARRTKDKLLITLLQKFRTRAKLIALELGATDYEIINLRISNKVMTNRDYYSQGLQYKAHSTSVSAPQFVAGEGKIGLQLNAIIELIYLQ